MYKRIRKHYKPSEAQELLARLVEFAESAELVGSDLSSARRLLIELLRIGPILAIDDAELELFEPRIAEEGQHCWKRSDFVNFQLLLKNVLRGIAALNSPDEDGGIVPTITLGRLELCAIPLPRNQVVIRVDGKARDVLGFQLVQLMHTAGVSRLLLCDCGRVYAKTGRRRFCSEKCQRRFYMRRFRAGKVGAEANERKAHHGGKASRKR